jgi:hypothetical protein
VEGAERRAGRRGRCAPAQIQRSPAAHLTDCMLIAPFIRCAPAQMRRHRLRRRGGGRGGAHVERTDA